MNLGELFISLNKMEILALHGNISLLQVAIRHIKFVPHKKHT